MSTITPKGKHVTRKPGDLSVEFYVRTALDQDHVIKLAELYDAGQNLPPLTITADNQIVDGRHRQQAAILAGRAEVDCIIVEEDSPVTMIANALRANEGGSKQPTREDIIHAIRLMIQEGAKEKQLYDLLPYPRPMSRKYIGHAATEISRSNLRKAKTAIAEDGLTARMAADKYNVSLERLKEEISPPKKSDRTTQFKALKSSLSVKSKSFSHYKAALMKRMVVGFIDGEVREEEVKSMLTHIDDLNQRNIRQLADFVGRFEAARRGDKVNWGADKELMEV